MPFSLRIALVTLLLLVVGSGPARGQDEPTVLPVAQGSTDVPYPDHARGDEAVELELVIDRAGSVVSAVVVTGEEPFAKQAQSAALNWRFTPALRAGLPVPARVRARVKFREPSSENASETPGAMPHSALPPAAPKTTQAAANPEATAEHEVTVAGRRQDVGQTTLSSSDIRAMPGAFGDPFRAIEALPGVAPIVSGLPYFYVRGAPPNDNGYFVDGIRVPLLFHVGIGEGVIHPGLIERVDFYSGAPQASYGRVVGATIVGQTREPAPVLHGEANLRLVDTGALLEVPFARSKGSVLVAPILLAMCRLLRTTTGVILPSSGLTLDSKSGGHLETRARSRSSSRGRT